MNTPDRTCEHGSAIEISVYSCESRDSIVPKLHTALAANGGWVLDAKRGAQSAEYSFEIELGNVLELYCGLVHAGLHMTELTHRVLTQLCVLRMNGGAAVNTGRVLNMRLGVSFLRLQEDLPEVVAASAQGC